MRIALVTETFPPEVNGVARTLRELVTRLVARGNTLEVIRPRQGRGDVARLDNAWTEILVPGCPIPLYRALRFGLPCRRRLRSQWRWRRPDVVHVATEGPLGRSAVGAAHAVHLPVVSSFHTNFHLYGRFYGYGALLRFATANLRRFHNRTRRTLVPTPEMIATLEAEGFRDLGLLGRGVDTELFHPAMRSNELRKTWGAGPDDPVALYVGRLAKEKNLDLVLRTFARLRDVVPRCVTVMVGDGPLTATVAKDHPNVHLAGLRRGDDLAAHYASGDFLVFPSLTETFGNVTTEAMASGTAVLAYDVAAARMHVENGVHGRVVAEGDDEAFLAAADELARHVDATRRMGAAAREHAETISWDAVVEGFETVLREEASVGRGELRGARLLEA